MIAAIIRGGSRALWAASPLVLAVLLGACDGQPAATGGAAPGVAVDSAAADEATGLRAEPARPERPAPALALTDQSGRDWSLDQGRGKVLLLFFGYTHCPDYCPQTLAAIGQAQRDLGPEAERLQVVMVSADPERDQPEVLSRYLEDQQPGSIGLTGEVAAVSAMAAAFGAEFHKDPVRQAGGAPGIAGAYTVTHTGRLYLIDPHGQIRGSYLGALSPDDVAQDVRALLDEES